MNEALTRLRFTAARLADCNIAGVRDLGVSMIREIDEAIRDARRPVKTQPAPIGDLSVIPVSELLGELARRLRANSRHPKICKKCAKNRCRAKGLCMRCYQRERKEQRRKRV